MSHIELIVLVLVQRKLSVLLPTTRFSDISIALDGGRAFDRLGATDVEVK